MRVGMEPVGPGAVDHLEIIDLRLAWADGLHGMPVAGLRDAQPVRVDDAVLGQVVVEVDAHLRAALHAQDRAEIVARQVLYRHAGTAQQLALIAPDAGLRPGQDLYPLLGSGDGDLGVWHEFIHLGLRREKFSVFDKAVPQQEGCTYAAHPQEITSAEHL